MALYLSPLVDVKEIDLSTTIPAVATSIAVTVIRDPFKGPELKQQLITSVDELIATFGEPTSGSYKDILSAVGYLKYGNKLYATAAFAPSATFAGCHGVFVSAGDLNNYTIEASGAYVMTDFASKDPDQFATETIVFDENREDFGSDIAIIAKSRGLWGNFIKIAIIGKNLYNNVRSQAYTYTQLSITSELYDDIDNIDVAFDTSTNTEFIIIVKVAEQDQVSKTTPVYFLKEAMFVSTNERKLDDTGGNIFCENYVNQTSKYIRCQLATVAKNKDMAVVFMDYERMEGGQNRPHTEVTDDDIIAAFDIYEDSETIDVNILIDSDKSITVKQRLIEIAESRKDCIAILDVPQTIVLNNGGQESTDLRDFRLGLHSTYNLNENTSYASLYGQWLEIYDKWNGKYRWIPSSGHVAGIYANTDDVTDPWFAPAGLNRGIITNIRKLAFNPNQGHRDIMYKNGINPVVSFAGQGKVVWGQKTMLDKSSAFNRVNVRRLFIILEKSIATAVKYFLFEPNDSFTRLQLINMIEPFLRDVKSRRGIYDFLVVCDSSNNTAERIDRNELWCDIYIKPTRAAEFIVLNFIATKTGASFTEIAATAAGATA